MSNINEVNYNSILVQRISRKHSFRIIVRMWAARLFFVTNVDHSLGADVTQYDIIAAEAWVNSIRSGISASHDKLIHNNMRWTEQSERHWHRTSHTVLWKKAQNHLGNTNKPVKRRRTCPSNYPNCPLKWMPSRPTSRKKHSNSTTANIIRAT